VLIRPSKNSFEVCEIDENVEVGKIPDESLVNIIFDEIPKDTEDSDINNIENIILVQTQLIKQHTNESQV